MNKKHCLFIIIVLSCLIIPLSIVNGQTIDEVEQLKAQLKAQKTKYENNIKKERQAKEKAEKNIRLLQKENDSLVTVIESIRAVEKGQSEAEANTKLVTINSEIKDPVFLEYLLRYCDMDNDGILTQWDAEHTYVIDISRDKSLLDGMNVFRSSNPITSIEGIEYFVNLKRLVCSGNSIPQVNLSKNPLLETFIANECKIKILEVSKNDRLTCLECSGNLLNTIDLKNHPNLQTLDVSNNKMAAIDISGCTKLRNFNCSGNALMSLDVSKNIALQTLDCSSNKISILSFANNTSLDSINCSNNKLTDVDVRNGILEMKFFDCRKNNNLEYVYFSKGCRIPPENDKRDARTYYK